MDIEVVMPPPLPIPSIDGEVWRPIPRFPLYEASDMGNIRYNDGVTWKPIPRYFVTRQGRTYVTVKLYRYHWALGNHVTVSLAKMVWEAFHGTTNRQVKYKNGDRYDCRLINLRTTMKE